MTRRRQLRILENPPPPSPADVLYVKPAGQGRACSNCVLYDVVDPMCSIHSPNLVIRSDMVCGYHVLGEPSGPRFGDIEFVDPKLSGLVVAPKEGTMCGNCRNFVPSDESETGKPICSVVAAKITRDGWEPATVDALGCCTRWEN